MHILLDSFKSKKLAFSIDKFTHLIYQVLSWLRLV